MGLDICVRAAELLHGALDTSPQPGGWVLPVRFAPEQLRALGSVRAWHPGVFRQMAACTAGVSLEFETDATRVELDLRLDEPPRSSRSVIADVERHAGGPKPPYDGVGIEIDDRRLPLALPDEKNVLTWLLDDPSVAPEPGLQRLPGMGVPHRVRVWLPCLTSCSVREVRSDGTYLTPVAAREQLLVLGDSIAQGFVGGDPGLTWPARLADHLGLDLVNQGLGAQVFQVGSLAGLAGRVRPAAVVVEFGANYRFEPCLESRVWPEIRTYLYEVAEAFPEVPVWVLTRLPHAEDVYETHPRSCADAIDGLIRRAAAPHANMRVVDGSALLDAGELDALLADGSDHPGPEGQRMIAERLAFVTDATAASPEARRALALRLAQKEGELAFPLTECLRRGLGTVLLASKGAVVVEFPGGHRVAMGPSRSTLRRALTCLGPGSGVTMVCGDRVLAREVARATDGYPRACNVVVWTGDAPRVRGQRDIRVLTPAYADLIRERYDHAEYFTPGELEDLLEAGAFLGGFEQGRLVGFVGEHAEGCMGALQVSVDHRREGWGTALAAAKVARTLEEGNVPWAEVWPDNEASLALERAMGFEVRPAENFWVVA